MRAVLDGGSLVFDFFNYVSYFKSYCLLLKNIFIEFSLTDKFEKKKTGPKLL